ncbi:cytochrome c biogenesis protein CcdA [Helcobacillus massiliensis]|uniref:Cytochrome c-type biogenesis protein n=1 Tax=Helcobacillus massiliensis TaxID=521392 RepID=A0A839QYH1_9MICO|nr:cytochrome c biogenesis protein CcdA [Helcobacillus massiliensis]MBB3023001.1 cytochrome c-type biogenesis protein [Helcobacillus massiliensis]
MSALREAFQSTILSGSLVLAVAVAALAGIVAFLSPCVFPVVPGYLGYVSGLAGQREQGGRRGRMVAGALLFIAGFTVVFMVIGGFVGALGYQLQAHTTWINRIAGVIVILMGLLFIGLFPASLSGEKRISKRPDAGLLGAPLMGMVFGFSWTPCIGPTFAAVTSLALDGASAERGAILALAYSLGLGLPFVLFAILFDKAIGVSSWLKRHRRAITTIGGVILIIIGTLLLTGQWAKWMDQLSVMTGTFETVI